MSRVAPCSTCPWRRDSDHTGAAIPGFQMAMMRALANTCGDVDEFRPQMACHHSPEGSPAPGEACGARALPCIGYVHVEGYSNLAVRIAALSGALDLPAIDRECASLDLFESFDEMLAAYERAQP